MKQHNRSLPLTALACLLVAGCAGTPTKTEPVQGGTTISDETYAGPPVTIESHTPRHTVVITTPTGGWSLIWDEKSPEGDAIYLTLRMPDPSFFHVQQLVPHRLDSTIATSRSLDVYVRLAAHDDRSDSAPYALAAHAD